MVSMLPTPWLTRLIISLSIGRPRVDSRPVHVALGMGSDIGTGPAPSTLVSHQLTFHKCSMLILHSHSLHHDLHQNHNLFYFIFLEVVLVFWHRMY